MYLTRGPEQAVCRGVRTSRKSSHAPGELHSIPALVTRTIIIAPARSSERRCSSNTRRIGDPGLQNPNQRYWWPRSVHCIRRRHRASVQKPRTLSPFRTHSPPSSVAVVTEPSAPFSKGKIVTPPGSEDTKRARGSPSWLRNSSRNYPCAAVRLRGSTHLSPFPLSHPPRWKSEIYPLQAWG